MAKVTIMDVLQTKDMDPMEFHFDNLWIYPMNYYLPPEAIEQLRQIATSVRLSSQIQKKYKMIDDIMVAYGFKRFSAGTNRVVYRHIEDTRFLAKIAVDRVGMQDNPLEFENQHLLKPFVTKMFSISPCGTVGFSERVLPVKNTAEFKEIASDVFDIIINKIIGLYVVEDIGTKYIMNWGIRPGFGPVLLDYPYVYKLDGNKLICNRVIPETGEICCGDIDYDAGFNHLICTRCGKRYLATDLRDDSIDNKIIITKGGKQMRIAIMKGNEVVSRPIPTDEVMSRPSKKTTPVKKNKTLKISIQRGDGTSFNPNARQVDPEPIAIPKTESPRMERPATKIVTNTMPAPKAEIPTAIVTNTIPAPKAENPIPKTIWSPDIEDEDDEIMIQVNEDTEAVAAPSIQFDVMPEKEIAPIQEEESDNTDEVVEAIDPRPMGTTQPQFSAVIISEDNIIESEDADDVAEDIASTFEVDDEEVYESDTSEDEEAEESEDEESDDGEDSDIDTEIDDEVAQAPVMRAVPIVTTKSSSLTDTSGIVEQYDDGRPKNYHKKKKNKNKHKNKHNNVIRTNN